MLQKPAYTSGWNLLLIGFMAFFVFLSGKRHYENEGFRYTITSDGSGYYAYLPSLLIFKDASFEKAKKTEAVYHHGNTSNLYVFKAANGSVYNKYFPGLAILQLPFFLLACLIAKLSGSPVDGYGPIFQFMFWLGSLVYTFGGLYFFIRFLKAFLKEKAQQLTPVLLLFYLATPIVFYSFFTPSFTHSYSFFLFALFFYMLVKLREEIRTTRLVTIGVVLGLIFLLRPTNLVIVLAAPLIWSSGAALREWITVLWRQHLRNIFWLAGSFLAVAFLLLLSWKWQTGNWIVWSYSGEGFDFLRPPVFSTLFSFRSGLFLHTPVVMLILLGWFYWFREERFRAIWWGIYALVNGWIIFSWWCWDYESPFGNRPFTEHMVLLILPLFFAWNRERKVVLTGLLFFALIGGIRLYNQLSGRMGDQRFTQENYLTSLAFWKKEHAGRWYFTRSCEPHGNVIKEQELFAHIPMHEVAPTEEFLFTASYRYPEKRNGARYYLRVTLDKKVLSPERFDNVFLVIDAAKEGTQQRFYKSIDLFNDIEEGRKAWKSLVLESQVYDFLEEYEQFTVYIWNPGKHHFQLKNVRYLLQVYR